MNKINPGIFKAYDIRGLYPEEINEAVAYRIGLAYAKLFSPKTMVVGEDVRPCNARIKKELVRGLLEFGVDVIDIGRIATDMLYFTVGKYGYDGGMVASASHNPFGYGGIKIVEKNVVPIFKDNKMPALAAAVINGDLTSPKLEGKLIQKDVEADYFDFILSFINLNKLKPQKIVVNANFGFNGRILKSLVAKKKLPLEIIPLNFEPDGSFPKGQPNPMVPENREETLALTKKESADWGAAWDADGDRIFFCDNQGVFYEAAYITAIMVENIFKKGLSKKTIYDVRYTWAIKEAAEKNGGVAIQSVVGRSFIMDLMRKEDIYFCGESSGHYYFKNNYYADNGMIPFLLLWEELSVSGKTLPELLAPYTSKFFVSGEFNTKVSDIAAKIKEVEEKYNDGQIDHLDGVTVEYPDWRFNLRPSNTEPLLRCNIEGKSQELVDEKKKEMQELLAK